MNVADTYFYLLENPRERQLGLAGDHIRYSTARFDEQVYSLARGKEFSSRSAAYQDWLDCGRQLGLQYNHANHTILKIVLKAKDEPELIDKWIAHHAGIVGYDNIIILDCGSENPDYLNALKRYSNHVIIFSYRKTYNNIHSPRANAPFFRLLAHNAKYVAVLDADEFLIGLRNGQFSAKSTVEILRDGNEDVYAGTWLNNYHRIPAAEGQIDWSKPISLRAGDKDIIAGTVAGKSVVSTRSLLSVSHIGHNLHVLDVAQLMSERSFGQIFIIHARALDATIVEERTAKHLRGKGVIPRNVHKRSEIEKLLGRYREDKSTLAAGAVKYVNMYLNRFELAPCDVSASTKLLGSVVSEEIPKISESLARIDFSAILKRSLTQLAIKAANNV